MRRLLVASILALPFLLAGASSNAESAWTLKKSDAPCPDRPCEQYVVVSNAGEERPVHTLDLAGASLWGDDRQALDALDAGAAVDVRGDLLESADLSRGGGNVFRLSTVHGVRRSPSHRPIPTGAGANVARATDTRGKSGKDRIGDTAGADRPR